MTTQFVNNQDLEFMTWENCHDGVGPFQIRDIIGGVPEEDRQKGFLKFLHDDVIPPKSTFGLHRHEGAPQEEWYYCLSGEGVMLLGDAEIPMHPGDISVCRTGGSHGIRNDSDEDLHILVIFASLPVE